MTDSVESSPVDRALLAQLCEVLEQLQAAEPTARRAGLLRDLRRRVEQGGGLHADDIGASVADVVADLRSMREGSLGTNTAALVRLLALPQDIADVLLRSTAADHRARKHAWIAEAEKVGATSVDWDAARVRLDAIEHEWNETRHLGTADDELWARFCVARSTFNSRHSAHLKALEQKEAIAKTLTASATTTGNITDTLREKVNAVLRNSGRPRPFRRGDLLIAESAPSDEVLLIETGKVKVVLRGAHGTDSIVAFYGPGELIGEMGVMGDRPRSADVVARTPGVAVHVDAHTFRTLLRDNPTVSAYLTDVLSARLSDAEQRQRLHASFEVSVRVARQLLSWAQSSGESVEGGGLRMKGLTQLEIAQFVTASVKSVDHAIRQLRSDKLLETGRRSYMLPDPQLLERCLADPDWRPGRGVVLDRRLGKSTAPIGDEIAQMTPDSNLHDDVPMPDTADPTYRLPEQHLLPDAVVAFVEDELSPPARDHAAAHIARCQLCATEVAIQRQADAAPKGIPKSANEEYSQPQDLTAREQQALAMIANGVDRNGYPPSIREIGEELGLNSAVSVAHVLKALERKGYLRRNPNLPRAVEIPAPAPESPRRR